MNVDLQCLNLLLSREPETFALGALGVREQERILDAVLYQSHLRPCFEEGDRRSECSEGVSWPSCESATSVGSQGTPVLPNKH